MAATISPLPEDVADKSIPAKKVRGRRKPLMNLSANETNISAGKVSSSPLPRTSFVEDAKENPEGLSLVAVLQKKAKPVSKPKPASTKKSFDDELQELQERLKQLQIEKVKTEELLKDRDDLLKQKEAELENRGKEQEKLQKELKKLQKLKEFKPTVIFPIVQTLRAKEKEAKKNKNNKKKKGCPEKKKPCPAYILWCKDQWNEVKKENPVADFKEISNMLGTKWKNLSAEEKQPYEEKYQQDKVAYLQVISKEKRENEAMVLLEEEKMQKTAMELLEQYLQFKQEADQEGKKTRKVRDPLKPKQPLSAFFLFLNNRRAALLETNKTILEAAKIAGEEWKNMTEEKRAPYEEIAKKQKEEYLQRMVLYKQRKVEEAENLEKEEEEEKKILKQEALQLLKKKEKTDNIVKKTKEIRQKKMHERKNSDPNKPKKPASSFLLYSKETRKTMVQERPGINNSALNAVISVKWKELNEPDRQMWNEKAAEAMGAYKKEIEEYNRLAAVDSGVTGIK